MRFVSINGITIHFEVSGPADAPPVLFVNSLGTDLRIWDDVVDRMSQTHRCVTFDKRGHGLSDSPAGPYSIDDHIGDIVGLADHLGIAKFDLVGVSIGGLIALGVASRHAERLRALVLCDSAAQLGSPASWEARIKSVQEFGMASIADAIMERWFSPAYRTGQPTELRGWRNMFLRANPAGYISNCATLRDTDLTAEAKSIRVPTLVVAGTADGSTPPELVKETARLIPGARFELIEGAGHLPSIERPAVLCDLIEAFLKEATR